MLMDSAKILRVPCRVLFADKGYDFMPLLKSSAIAAKHIANNISVLAPLVQATSPFRLEGLAYSEY